jgi:hypothetical protein
MTEMTDINSNIPKPGDILELEFLSINQLVELSSTATISKNQKKKIEKRIKWIEQTPARREKRRERKKSGKCRASKLRTNEKIKTESDFEKRFHIGLDFGHEQQMTQSEMKDLAKQTRRCYQHYRRCHQEVQFYLLDFDSNPNFIQTMERHADGYKSWDVHLAKTILDFNDRSKQ